MGGGGEVPELALARSERFVRVLSQPLVEQPHGSFPEAFHQMPGCMADSRDSIVPGQFSFSPGFDAELPAVPAPQRVILHPHQLHSSTSRELLAYPW